MKHSEILHAALMAGTGLRIPSTDTERELYDYARARKFPVAETLARKAYELAGDPFPWPSLAIAPEPIRAHFTAFRAVVEALEPFHEDDPPEGWTPPAPAPDKEICRLRDELEAADEEVELVGTENRQLTARVDELQRKIVDLETALAQRPAPQPAPVQEQEEDMTDAERAEQPEVDEIERKRRAGQAEMDKAIAESGGKFSAPEDQAREAAAETPKKKQK